MNFDVINELWRYKWTLMLQVNFEFKISYF